MAKTTCLKTTECLISEDKTEKWPFNMIHSNIERRSLETIDVFVCQIEAKQTSLIMEFIYEYLAFDPSDLSYLKRVRKVEGNDRQPKLDVILHSTMGLSLEDLKRKLKEQSIDVDVRIIQVSKYPPLTRSQFCVWNLLWPLHFRINMAKKIKFTDESLLKLKALMNHVWNFANEKSSIENASYLCKDLIVITTHEPCVMCCMALVHSRIFRTFYSIAMPKTGGLESNYHIHGRNELNHKYQAFGGFTVENTLNTINDYVHI
ncbi:uncharacterized protein T551_01516 [Pneumocystis jirovecii RU7]|uniref:CMP/dCMP-type deaminase domain-containing protein n=1 Tax=Pneumocystis jirovecii (strain RU7) TaxID=1408657 RepID=A0A0W4ZRH4_PNEJ7|nr:uncharacterized protein T551_01516 [Pneumocystis jirovecii RU7]KTW30964.1 hypothetical protein T551_01516 [Pneumocystis jirovecii RU7]